MYKSANGGKDWYNKPLNLGKAHDHQTLIQDRHNNIIYLVSIQGNDIYVNYSTDEGSSFNNPRQFTFSNLGSNTMTPIILDNGTLMISFTTFNRPAINGSRNAGKSERLKKNLSWLIPYTIEEGFGTPMFISEECETGFPVLTNNIESNKFQDHMYYICSSQTDKSILFHSSNTSGKSWSRSIPISNYTNTINSSRNPFTGMPQITVNKYGVVGIIWQDRTEDPNSKCQNLYFTASKDGGKTFLKPKQISSQQSCMENDQNKWAGSRYKSGGDYTGFISDEKGEFIVIWPDSRNGISQLYMARIKVED